MVVSEMAKNNGQILLFFPENSPKLGDALKQVRMLAHLSPLISVNKL